MATYAYDKMDRPLWLQLKEGTSAAFYVVRNSPVATYRAFGPLASLRFDLGTDRDETRGYDFRYSPTSITVSGSLFNWSYTTDALGDVTAISQTLPTPTVSRSYGYQEWQSYLSCAGGPWNLAAASCNPATNSPIEWTYDKVGNRLSEARDGTTDSYAYQQNAATSGNTATLDQVTLGIGGTRDYSFDAAGYLELVDLGANEIAFGFDAAGTLGTIARPLASESLTLAYDGRGFLRQADDAVTGGWLKPLYSSDGRLMSLERLPTSAGTAERINVLYFAGRPVAIWRKVGTSTATWNPIVTDHLGTPVYALTQAGAQHWIGGFEPFGRDHQQGTGQDSLTKGIFLRLPGQWDDPLLTGATLGADVYYNVHRWYEQQRGFYASADPVGLRAGLNLFSYAYASPLRFVDPEGLFSVNPHLVWPFSCSFAVAAQARADGSSRGGGRGWRWAHCWASCEISRSCGGPLLAKAFGLLKEVLDLPKCAGEILAGKVVPDGNCDSAFQASDFSDNDFGITCPASKTCDERCGPLIGQGAPHGPFLAPALGAQRAIGR